jgi:hypothetical protein
MRATALAVIVVLLLSGCTDEEGATEAIKDMGLTPIAVGGYGWFDCSEDDQFATKFTARNAQGRNVAGTVCSGWFKGKTVRLD